MKRSSRVPIIILALLLLASCGKQYEAKGLVKDFVKQHAAEEVDISSFSKLDSTRVISDSLIQVFRSQKDELFDSPIDYVERKGQTLYFIRMRYKKDTLELSRTFYFNPDLEGIVAFK